MSVFRLVFILLLVIAGCSCKHEPQVTRCEVPTASVTFLSPAPGATCTQGEKIAIGATAVSTAPIHGYDLSIHGAADKTVYYFNHIHGHNDTLTIREAWTNILASATDLEAEITLYLNHEGNLHKAKTKFKTE